MVGLSQFNRSTSASKDRPSKEGLLGGSSLENDADQVILLDHSRVEPASVPQEGWTSYALVEKNRHGALVEVPIAFDKRTLRIRERYLDELAAVSV
jgi:replicative DNA helicase